jgi:hypothetical protein
MKSLSHDEKTKAYRAGKIWTRSWHRLRPHLAGLYSFIPDCFCCEQFCSTPGCAMPQGLSAALGVIMCIFLPVFYAVFGGLFGMLAAWIYNVVAGWTGGIEFEVE